MSLAFDSAFVSVNVFRLEMIFLNVNNYAKKRFVKGFVRRAMADDMIKNERFNAHSTSDKRS